MCFELQSKCSSMTAPNTRDWSWIASQILLINQQLGIFIGLLARAGAVVDDIPVADIWIMDPGVKNLDTIFPLRDTELAVFEECPVFLGCSVVQSAATVRTESGQLESA